MMYGLLVDWKISNITDDSLQKRVKVNISLDLKKEGEILCSELVKYLV
jgi:hypothetical protein